MVDVASGSADYFAAPTKFLGNWTANEATSLSFDFRLTSGTPDLTFDVFFYSGSSDFWRATWPSAPLASHQWNHFSVDLSQTLWTHGGAGTRSWQDSLASVTGLYLDAEVIYGGETTRMDNFRLVTGGPMPLPGDFNGDAAVDAADYIVWRNGLGTTYTPDDYNTWRENFGQQAGGSILAQLNALSANIPEPGAIALVLIGAALVVSARKKPRSRTSKEPF
jgi:hypothetical protein